MFRNLITAPINPIPQQYIDTIARLENEPDYSLTSLGIALLRPRIDPYAGIAGVWGSHDTEMNCVDDFIDNRYPYYKEGTPMLCYYKFNKESNEEEVIKKLTDLGFVVKESIGTLAQQKSDVKCLAMFHPEENCAVIFVNSADAKVYHFLISVLSLLFPKLFADKPLTDEEKRDLLMTMTKTSDEAFIQAIQKFVKPYENEFRRLMLSSFLKSMHSRRIESAKRDMDNMREHSESCYQEYLNALASLKEKIALYEGYKIVDAAGEGEEEFVKYLSENKAIYGFAMQDNTFSFAVATYLSNYNPDAWKRFSQAGHIYDGAYGPNLEGTFGRKENRKKLLDQIFSESPIFTIKIAGNYKLNLSRCELSCNSGYNYERTDPIFKDYLPNPHIKNFSCLGDYKRRVTDLLRAGNYIGAIEMCCASAGSVNLDETANNFRPMLGWLLTSDRKVLHCIPTGEDMTPEEALEYIKANKK